MIIPNFIETLNACREAYAMAATEYSSTRFLKREYEGGLPKRRSPIKKIIERLHRRNDCISRLATSGAMPRRMIIASYDQGLLDTHNCKDDHQ